MENQKQKKSAGTVVLVVLLLIVTIAALILATYAWARYTTVETGGATAQVAKWDVKFSENENGIFHGTYTHVVENRLAPGMTGDFTMHISSSLTETDYDYKIALTHLENKPTNLHFYAKRTGSEGNYTYSDEIRFENATGARDAVTASNIYGHVALDKTTNGGKAAIDKDVTIYWVWEYQTANITDFPADIDTVYTVKPAEGSNEAETTTKRKRIVHDLNVLLMQKGIIESETADGCITDTTTLAQMKAKASGSLTEADIMKAINDAIDTVDGMAALTMKFDTELTAIQCDPSTGETEFTQYL